MVIKSNATHTALARVYYISYKHFNIRRLKKNLSEILNYLRRKIKKLRNGYIKIKHGCFPFVNNFLPVSSIDHIRFV